MVADGLANDAVLDSYGTERSTHAREIIDAAVDLGRIICELDPTRATERDKRMSAELADPNALTVEPPHPRLGQPSITAPGDALAGSLSLQARVSAGGVTGLFDDVIGGGWQLIALDADPLADAPDELRTWFASIGGTAVQVSADGTVRDIDGDYRAWFHKHRCGVVLARPDFYIFGTGDSGDAPRLLELLRGELTSGRINKSHSSANEGANT
jgi:3-(3-hydroxy-phenyl)propionate hydroxylase